MQIFCPSNHLILNQNTCPQCGWKRPITTTIGKALWEIQDLNTGLGAENEQAAAHAIVVNNTLILSLKTNELVGINIATGTLKWRKALPVGLQVTGFVSANQQVVISLKDFRSLMDGDRFGCLYQINTRDGSLIPLWKAPSHNINAVINYNDQFILRTSSNTIYGLKQSDPIQIAWQIKTSAWVALPIIPFKNRILYMDGSLLKGKIFIQCFDLVEEKFVWKTDLSQGDSGFTPVANERILFVVDGTKMIKAIEIESGKVVWEKNFLRIYSPPSPREGILSFAIQGNADLDAEDHYTLVAFEIGNWNEVFRAPLASKTTLAAHITREQIMIGCHDGSVRCFDIKTGKPAWQYQLGGQQDPIKTNLTVYENMLLVGSAQGKLALLTIQQRDQLNSPESYMHSENWHLAATAFALQNNLKSAAELYQHKIKDFPKALQLYAFGGYYAEAAQLAFENDLWMDALNYYQKAGNNLGLAETYLKMGNDQKAAEIYVATGDSLQAAKLMEKAEKYRLAIDYYSLAKCPKDVYRLKFKLGLFNTSDLSDLRKQNRFSEVAELELQNGLYEDAAKDFQKADLPMKALTALQLAAQKKPSELWIWEEMAQIAENLNQFEISGEAWMKLEKPLKAGNAYKLAAETLLNENPQNMDEIADCYEKAMDAYEYGGYDEVEDYLECQQKQRELRKYPNIILRMIIPGGNLKEFDWSHIFIEFTNDGFGIAENIWYEIDCDRFEIDKKKSSKMFHLDQGLSKRFEIDLRPQKEEHGDVPLQIQWIWEKKGEKFERCESQRVTVKTKEDPRASHSVNIIYGDQVGQKGDAVTINRGVQSRENPSVSVEENHHLRNNDLIFNAVDNLAEKTKQGVSCPECSLINDMNARYCKECGTKLYA